MTKIHRTAFLGCNNLSNIYFEGIVPLGQHSFGNPNGEVKPFKIYNSKCVLHVPRGSKDSYQKLWPNHTIVEEWTKNFTVGNSWDLDWIENIVRGAKQDAEFNWKINWKEIYKSEYNSNKVQSFPNIILTEVMWVEKPEIWAEIDVNSIWHGVITTIEKDSDWYDAYVVDFNDPKTYSELSYSIKVINIEKN